jgi:ribosomal protein S21
LTKLENSLAMINNTFDRALSVLKRIIGKLCTIQVWKAQRYSQTYPELLTAAITAKIASTKY